MGSSQQTTFPALSETHTTSHPHTSQTYAAPLSAFLAVFACTFFFALGFAVFATVLALAIILPLSFHQEDLDDVVELDVFFFAIILPPLDNILKINLTILQFIRIGQKS